VHWRLNAEDDANQDADGNNLTASVYGTQSLDTSDISSFIAFDSVDAATVQGWVETAMGEDEVQSLKDNLDANIAEQITPASVTKNLVG
jgi:alkyl hydroperoxide reductase subunit AhpF